MKKDDVQFFCCLKCKKEVLLEIFETDSLADENINEGALFCPSCRLFYPVTEGIPFLLDSGYYTTYFDVQGFIKKWNGKFDFSKYKLLTQKTIPEKMKQLNFYNEDSESYDELVSNSVFWRANDWNTLYRWIAELPKDGTALDMGCGTGRCTIPLAKSGRRVIATDISVGMLKKAIKKSAVNGVTNITYFLADAEDLPLKPSLFSTVISFGVLHHVNKPATVIEDIKKILRPKGVFYALENNATPIRWLFDMLMKISKLWNEEAGSHPLFNIKEIEVLIRNNGMYPEIKTSTFLPPHLFNVLTYTLAKKTLSVTDWILGNIPLLKDFGGQLVIKATKSE